MSSDTPGMEWFERVAEVNRQYADAAEQTMNAQSRFVDAWLDSVDQLTRQNRADETAASVANAYEVWMQAADDALEQVTDVVEGEDVDVERFRDTWLNAANRAFKETMETSAFAYATGQGLDDALELRQQFDDITEDAVHEMGLPTEGDVTEIGERLVELERRQHAVEQRLDRILDAVETEGE
ncbi:poly(R)-hydroxyalkanoic acid synthase subunit PhaE [Halobacterium litoreum]|uniref:Poly(3-hydroxyalkanoate) polymerase subunit PhaE n=1 Tax=Halobacterium litoreum TaxID=2039234 RepID=A0ABD5NBZ5_9EURY|nr:poly(R)-hydroxyalkanoic acid synthase subunit PhaE [Halobacterium litoreum]UHH14543.1 poly(R)-hydroxyalkanoic acid synthase subunit [Halobacterium litoreum]